MYRISFTDLNWYANKYSWQTKKKVPKLRQKEEEDQSIMKL